MCFERQLNYAKIRYVVSVCAGEEVIDEKKCDGIVCEGSQKVYAEIGCKPVVEDGECCPSRYDCSHIHQLNKTQCHFKNVTVEAGRSLDDTDTTGMCHAACYCTE